MARIPMGYDKLVAVGEAELPTPSLLVEVIEDAGWHVLARLTDRGQLGSLIPRSHPLANAVTGQVDLIAAAYLHDDVAGVKLGVCERWHRFRRIRLGTDGQQRRAMIDLKLTGAWLSVRAIRWSQSKRNLSRRSQSERASDTLGGALT